MTTWGTRLAPSGSSCGIARPFGQVSRAAGFEAFELLRPRDGDRYLVYTRWQSREDFERWMSSSRFEAGHRQHSASGPVSRESEVWELDVLQAEYGPAR